MAINFISTSNKYLEVASSPISTLPLTIACWAKPTSTVSSCFVSVGQKNGTHRYILQQFGQFVASASNGTSTFSAITTTNATLNQWNHGCAVFSSSSSRTAYLNGGNAGTNTSSITLNTPNSVVIGARYNTTLGLYFSGDLAEVGIWNNILSLDEIQSLSKGMTCDKVRPQSLVFYAPLVRDLNDQKGGLIITNNNGATIAPHPRVYA